MLASFSLYRHLFWILFLLLAGISTVHAESAVTTWHYDNARTGVNAKETLLTPQNVVAEKFGKLFTRLVDGAIIGTGALPSRPFHSWQGDAQCGLCRHDA